MGLVSTVGVSLLKPGVEVSVGPAVGLVPAAGVVLEELLLLAVGVIVELFDPLDANPNTVAAPPTTTNPVTPANASTILRLEVPFFGGFGIPGDE